MSFKQKIRFAFSPVLNIFESGTEPYHYKPSQRKILLFVGSVFTGLSALVLWLALGEDPGYLIPVFIFGAVGLVSLIVGSVGNERGVAKIWGSSK